MEQPKILQHLYEKAYRAYSGTSFSPERRAESIVNDYSAELTEDLITIEAANEETKARYKEKYICLLSHWLSAKSRCVSTMIAGPANFPVERMRKYNSWEESAYKTFQGWRENSIKAILKEMQPVKTNSTDIERYKSELEAMQGNHEKMKQANKIIKEAIKNGKDISEYLTTEFGIMPHMIEWTMKFGFGLTNNNAKMKRVEGRIKELSRKEEIAQTTGNTIIPFEGGEIILNYEANRLQIKHDQKPSAEVIANLKSNGFKWSPTFTAWQSFLTNNSKWKAGRMLGIEIKTDKITKEKLNRR